MSICLNITTVDISAYTYTHDICIYLRFRFPRASLVPPSSSPSSYVTRRSFHVSLPPPVNSPPFGFVGKRNRTCPSAHVRTSGCVSRVSTFDGMKDERRRKGRAMQGGGGDGQGGKGRRESRVRKIYYDLLADAGRSVCHPCPPLCRPPATAPSVPSLPPPSVLLSYSPSILVVLRRVTPLSFRRRSKNKVPDSRCMNDNLIAGGLKSRKRCTRTYRPIIRRASHVVRRVFYLRDKQICVIRKWMNFLYE